MTFTVAGGDTRFAMLCGILAGDGHEVRAFALDHAELPPAVKRTGSAAEAAEGCGCLILPLPVSRFGDVLNASLADDTHLVSELINCVPSDCLVCGGLPGETVLSHCRSKGLACADYFQREELTAVNAVATAEGAISVLMAETPMTLWQSRILVTGFGRIGRLLAHKLESLGAKVTVSARSCGDMAWIRAWGWDVLDTRALKGHLGHFDIIVNTVPAPVLDAELLSELKSGVLCLDLASRPGGIDLEAAGRLGVRTVWALGLPGEAAPLTAGAAIKDAVYNILKEQGRL